MPPWVAKEKIGTLLLASEMPVPIPRSRTVGRSSVLGGGSTGEVQNDHKIHILVNAPTGAVVTEQVPINTNSSHIHTCLGVGLVRP